MLPDYVRLVDNACPFPQNLQYATLSHSWGQLEFHKLCKGNIQSMKTSVPESALTRTFQDAIRITRELGLQYLWIDSLCILQDCKEDWKRECTLMTDVYSNSLVNLRACDAINGDGGCYYTDSEMAKPGGIYYEMAKSRGTNYEMSNRGGTFRYIHGGGNTDSTICWDFMPSELFKTAADSSHLASRAWALQERLLPLRKIHFSKIDMFWECKTKIASSVSPEGLLNDFLFRLDNRMPLMELWSNIVEQYSRCNLTRLVDKVIALSGVARKINEETGITYLAGLWRKKIEIQLCWYTWNAKLRSDTFQAPTVCTQTALVLNQILSI